MGRIFCIMGKSASGKDSIYQHLLEKSQLELRRLVSYTTRPIRRGEVEGREYYFTDEVKLEAFRAAGKVIESRSYDTVHGTWTYFTADDGQMDWEHYHYLCIGTLESYRGLRAYFGTDMICPIYIEVEDGERLKRAIRREEKQEQPKYEELCRRFLADARDFAEEKITAAGIQRKFQNHNREICLTEIENYIRNMI